MTIGERITSLRKESGMTQNDLAKKIGSSRNTIACYEIGVRNPTGTATKSIAKEFGVKEEWLKTGEGEKQDNTEAAVVAKIVQMLSGENPEALSLFKAFAEFGESDWQAVKKFMQAIKKDETL
ncbi:helix-turn-helix domain-containing protein [Caproicibacterium sp. BJN0003]|uniref:helix-turn-helix domain-containing protein n=1 Tax=Caproicibacterium sp. BJN0003 TaxID=2994078 RepID=UPI00224D8D94|nr:helix-turn-helix transcriptional regulator [Caproicibacterium sp. BJN0003]UZT82108.1 helix-turn-helix transcriptional regulator [Caproicibacterium sp. BJN0003]